MSNQAIRNLQTLKRCQEHYDHMSPPDEYCPVCHREASCECICDGTEIIDEEEE